MQASSNDVSTGGVLLGEAQSVQNSISAGVNQTQADEQQLSAANDGADVLKDTPDTFSQLDAIVNGGGNYVELNKNYSRADASDLSKIIIDRELTIEGHGNTISGNSLDDTRIFEINTTSKVTFNNIIFTKATKSALYFSQIANCEFNNCKFTDNAISSSTDFGAAIYFDKSLTGAKFINCTFYNNSLSSSTSELGGGAAIYVNSSMSDSVFDNCNFTENIATGSNNVYMAGGALLVKDKVTNCEFRNTQFVENSVNSYWSRAGAIYFGDVVNTLKFYNVNFLRNSANNILAAEDNQGGALFFGDISYNLNYTNVNFIENSVNSKKPRYNRGGAIYYDANIADDSYSLINCTYTNCNFVNNTAQGDGGAIYNYRSTRFVNYTNVNFIGNKANVYTTTAEGGGAICIELVSFNTTFTNCVFDKNEVINVTGDSEFCRGGAIYFAGQDPKNRPNLGVNYNNVTFTNNYAHRGGALYYHTSATMSHYYDCDFINNTADGIGGAIYHYHGDIGYVVFKNITYKNVRFINNTITGRCIWIPTAAALYDNSLSENYSFINVTFDNNKVFAEDDTSMGGAIAFYGSKSDVLFKNLTFTNNGVQKADGTVLGEGGAIFLGTGAHINMYDCNFTNNSAKYGGMIYYNSASSYVTFARCIIANNSAYYGGAIYSRIYLVHNTFNETQVTGNTASKYGGAIYMNGYKDYYHYSYTANVYSINSNFTHNSAVNGSVIYTSPYAKTQIVLNSSSFLENIANVTINFDFNKTNLTGVVECIFGDNLINAIYTQDDVEFNNVTYFDYDTGITNTDVDSPSKSIYHEGRIIVLKFSDLEGNELKTISIPTQGRYTQFKYDVDSTADFNIKAFFEDDYYVGEGDYDVNFGDFDLLQLLVNKADENTVLDLPRNFTYTIALDTITQGVVIGKNITIDGHGYTVDALFMSRIFNIQADNVILKNIRFVNGNSTVSGGAIFADNVDNIQVMNCEFENCTALNGGSIFINGSDNSISGCNFTENLGLVINATKTTKYYYGSYYKDFTYTETSYVPQFSPLSQYGGAIYIGGNHTSIKNSRFTNINTNASGAIYGDDVSNVDIDGCAFEHCSAGMGGAIALSGKSIHVSNSNFTNNTIRYSKFLTAVKYKGWSWSSSPWQDHYETEYLYLANDSGAIYINADDSSIRNSNFNDLIVKGNAGAVYVNGSNVTIENSHFNKSFAAKYGFAIVWEGEYGKLLNSTFEGVVITYDEAHDLYLMVDNSPNQVNILSDGDSDCAMYGSMVYWMGNHGYMHGLNFTDNYVSSQYLGSVQTPDGDYYSICRCLGAIYVMSAGDVLDVQSGERISQDPLKYGLNVTVDDCYFANNEAFFGEVIWSGLNGTLTNSRFMDTSNNLAAVLWRGDNGRILDNNFTRNKAYYYAPLASQGANTRIMNSVFTENSGSDGGCIAIFGPAYKSDDETFIAENLEKYGAYAVVDNCIFIKNYAHQGGAVFTNGYKTLVANSKFHDNRGFIGGALAVGGLNEIFSNLTFENNSAILGGAAVVGYHKWVSDTDSYVNYGNSTVIKNSTFKDNYAEIGGAILWLTDNGEITDNVLFENNTIKTTYAMFGSQDPIQYYSEIMPQLRNEYSDLFDLLDSGAAIVWIGANGNINNATFKNNNALPYTCYERDNNWIEDAIELNVSDTMEDSEVVEMAKQMVIENLSKYDGYELYEGDIEVISEDSTTHTRQIRFYYAAEVYNMYRYDFNSSAGAIYWMGNDGVISDTEFESNFANYGGAIYQKEGSLKLSNSKFLNNKANSSALIVVNQTNTLNITLVGWENYLNAIYTENDDIEFDNVEYWNGNIVNTKDVQDGTSTNESGQNITVEIYKDDQLVMSVSELSSPEGNLYIDFSGILKTGNYSYIAYHPDDRYYTYVASQGMLLVDSDKKRVNLTVNVENIQYGENATINVTLTDHDGSKISGVIVNVTINGKVYEVEITNGTGLKNVSGLGAKDNYLATAVFSGNDTHVSVNAVDYFNVTKINSTLKVNNMTFVYGSSNSTAVEYEGASNVTAYVVGHDEAIVTVGDHVITVSGLPAGNFVLNVTTVPDENHTAVSALANVSVSALSATVNVSDASFNYSQPGNITVNATGAKAIEAKVVGYDGADIKVDGNNITVSGLPAGNYTLNVTVVPDENHTAVSKLVNITVNPIPSTLNASDVELNYSESGNISYNTTGAQGITAEVVGHSDAKVEVNGNNITVSGLPAGSYTLNVTTIPDENHTAVSKEVNLTVLPSETELNVTSDAVEGYNSTITVKVPEDATGNVTVTIDGKNYTAPVENGTATITGPVLTGNTTAKVTYGGDNNHKQKTVETNITLRKAMLAIDASDMKRGWDSPYDYMARIVDEKDNPVSNKTLKFTVAGKDYNVTTDADGVAKLTTSKLAVGNYDVTVTLPETGQNATQKLEIVKRIIENKDLTMDYKDGHKFSVRAIGDDGNPVGSGVIVKIKINGVTYSLKTDANGYAKLPINLIPKKYVATSTYHKTTVKNKVVVKQVLKVSKTVKVKKTAKKFVLKATLKWTNGKPIKKKTIKFKFNGKTYKAKTNTKGVAKVTIKKNVIKKLKKGKKYTYSAKYIDDVVKGKVWVR